MHSRVGSESDMTDSETPQPNPERDPSPGDGEPGVGPTPEHAQPVPETPAAASQPAVEAQAVEQAAEPGVESPEETPRAPRPPIHRRRSFWAALALLCVAVGIAASLLGAHAVAHRDAVKAQEAFPRTATGIAATLRLAVQREEELASARARSSRATGRRAPRNSTRG